MWFIWTTELCTKQHRGARQALMNIKEKGGQLARDKTNTISDGMFTNTNDISKSLSVKRTFCSHCTLSGGSHCFQPAQTHHTDPAAVQGVHTWCSSASTVVWRTPLYQQIPRCRWFVFLSRNPGWLGFFALHKHNIHILFNKSSFSFGWSDN